MRAAYDTRDHCGAYKVCHRQQTDMFYVLIHTIRFFRFVLCSTAYFSLIACISYPFANAGAAQSAVPRAANLKPAAVSGTRANKRMLPELERINR